MSSAKLTRHAVARMGQRGFYDDDLDLIRLIGTEVEDGYIVPNRDRQAAERELKRLLERIRRLHVKRVVVASGRVVTVYHAGKAMERRLVRGAEDRSWRLEPATESSIAARGSALSP